MGIWHGSRAFITNSTFKENTDEQNNNTVTVCAIDSLVYITSCIFEYNTASLYAFSSTVTFTGHNSFKNCIGSKNTSRKRAGAITSLLSSLFFTGVTKLLSNQAGHGGAVCVVGSTISVSGQITVVNNAATIGIGGGFHLEHSDMKIFGNLHISHNHAATYGGGIHARSSTISVYQPGLLQFSENSAEVAGGGLYLSTNTKVTLLKHHESASIMLMLQNNNATYGGAVYVADSTNSGCRHYFVECFI